MGWKMIRIMVAMFFLGIIFFPSSLYSEWICIAPNGCPINMDTGECPNCIWEENEKPKILTEFNKTTVKKSIKPLPTSKPSSKMCVWRCVVAPCDDDMLPDECVWKNA